MAIAVCTVLALLHVLAARLTASHLTRVAGREISALQHHQPLWSWQFSRKSDLVAGRAFGRTALHAASSGLTVTSIDGTPFELGLPIQHGLDLLHWPLLRVDFGEPVAGQLTLIWQATSGPACVVETPLHDLGGTRTLDLRALAARSTDGSGSCGLPTSAHMLRLRVTMRAGQSMHLRGAALLAPTNALVGDASVFVPTRSAASTSAWLQTLDQRGGSPVVSMPAGASAETQLAWRDRIVAVRPAALVLPHGAALIAAPDHPVPAALRWLGCIVYLALLLLGLRPLPGRRGLFVDLVACLAGPLWLIAGLQLGIHPSPTALLAFAGSIGFAAWTQHRVPSGYHWIGSWRAPIWWLPLVALPAALLLCLLAGHRFEALLPRHVLVYLGWALLQQWLILAVVLGRLERLLPGNAAAVLLAALVFALLHTPNGVLMQLCFLAELGWAWCFLRSRALLPIALAHAGSALIIESGLTGSLLRSLEVGTRFFS